MEDVSKKQISGGGEDYLLSKFVSFLVFLINMVHINAVLIISPFTLHHLPYLCSSASASYLINCFYALSVPQTHLQLLAPFASSISASFGWKDVLHSNSCYWRGKRNEGKGGGGTQKLDRFFLELLELWQFFLSPVTFHASLPVFPIIEPLI